MLIYHNIKNDSYHQERWAKNNRILQPSVAKWFENSSSISRLLSEYDAVAVADEEGLGRPNYYWRLTRPNENTDVGPMHRDEWFWLSNNCFQYNMEGLRRIKVWIAIQTEPGLNGLLVEPGSHKRDDIKWEPEFRQGMYKPRLVSVLDTECFKLLETPPGYGVIFHDKLLHGGSINRGKICRLSIEFTMLVPDS
jgi:ectoine hydroxylase-related dioxygenase (phytanoyl-CoA dioxygenase family)